MSNEREILERFIEAIAGGQIPDQKDLQAVSDLLEQVLAGGELKLKRPRGAPPNRNNVEEQNAIQDVLSGRKKIQDLPCGRSTYYRWLKKHKNTLGE